MAVRFMQAALRRALRDAGRRPNSWGADVARAMPDLVEDPNASLQLLRQLRQETPNLEFEGLPPRNDIRDAEMAGHQWQMAYNNDNLPSQEAWLNQAMGTRYGRANPDLVNPYPRYERGQSPYEMVEPLLDPPPLEGQYARTQDLLRTEGLWPEYPREAVRNVLGREQGLDWDDPAVFRILLKLLGVEGALRFMRGGGA